jgi:hypothetical protein
MSRKAARVVAVLVICLAGAMVCYFLLPFGLPKIATPNCGPEHWRWLGSRFESKADVITYLQAHELELLSGSSTPRLEPFFPGMVVSHFDVEIDWEKLENDIQVEQRLGYTVYTLTYHHPACSEHQNYTLKVTSFGFASLYGCCGV